MTNIEPIGPATEMPAARPASVRRASHLDIAPSENALARNVEGIAGRAVDTVVGPDGRHRDVARAELSVTVGDDGLIEWSESRPGPALDLVGLRLGPGFRAAVRTSLEDLGDSPLGLLLGDLPGAPSSMRYGIARRRIRQGLVLLPPAGREPHDGPLCAGRRFEHIPGHARAPMLEPPPAPDLGAFDSAGSLGDLPAGYGRRRRLIEVSRTPLGLSLKSFFRDSNFEPDGDSATEVVVHEYELTAETQGEKMEIRSLIATPHVLPHDDCPLAVLGLETLVGASLPVVARQVHRRLQGEESCTHLNDMIRFLAGGADMIRLLPEAA